jgi:hypothetical protein
MARRVFVVWVAIISLALLVQAAPSLATTYDLESDNIGDWVEMFPEISGGYTPGSIGSTFVGSHTWEDNLWQIGDLDAGKILTSTQAATQEDLGGGAYKFTYTYGAIEEGGLVRFKVSIPSEGVNIISYDAQITITVIYILSGASWTYQQDSGIIEGTGTNSLDDQLFTFTGTLYESYPDHTHGGYIKDFELNYPASAVPIPGTVWLLSTGFLGIWCLGRRGKG